MVAGQKIKVLPLSSQSPDLNFKEVQDPDTSVSNLIPYKKELLFSVLLFSPVEGSSLQGYKRF